MSEAVTVEEAFPATARRTACLVALAGVLISLAACADGRAYLRNEATGEVVVCGGVHPVTLAESGVQRREEKCIDDFLRQGYVRIPPPK